MSKKLLFCILDPAWVSRIGSMPELKAVEGRELFFCTSYEASEALSDRGYAHKTQADYLGKDDIRGINDMAFDYCTRWFKTGGVDMTLHEGISLGDITQRHVGLLLNRAIEVARTLNNLFSREDIEGAVILYSQEDSALTFRNMLCSAGNYLYLHTIAWLCKENGIPLIKKPLRSKVLPGLKSAARDIMKTSAVFIVSMINSILNLIKRYKTVHAQSAVLCHSFHYFGRILKDELLNSKGNNILVVRKDSLLRNLIFSENVFQYLVSCNCYFGTHENRLRKEFLSRFDILNAGERNLPVIGRVHLWDIFRDFLRDNFEKKFIILACQCRKIEKIVERYHVGIVVMSNDVEEFERTLVSVAVKNHVKSIVLQHGCMNHPLAYLPLKSDIIGVWGEHSKRWLSKHGCDESRIRVIGAPRYDLYKAKPRDKNKVKVEVCGKLGIPEDRIFLLYATQAVYDISIPEFYLSTEELAETFARLASWASARKDCYLVVKLKKDKSASIYNGILNKMGNPDNIKVISDFDMYNLLGAADILFTISSAVGIESIMMDVPMITLDFIKENPSAYSEGKAAISVNNTEELNRAVDSICRSRRAPYPLKDSADALLSDYIYKMDGKASERAYALISEISSHV